MKHLIFLISILVGIYSNGHTQSIDPTTLQEIQRRVDHRINPAISIGILHPNGSTEFFNFGSHHLDQNESPSPKTLYEIGSVTKTFTAWLTLHYLGNSLHEPLKKLLPGHADSMPHLGEITPWQLLHHTSGLPRLAPTFSPEDWANPYADYTHKKMLEELDQLQLGEDKKWAYSNLGYAYLGWILEQKTGLSYDELMHGLLVAAKMKHSLTAYPDVIHSNIATPTHVGQELSRWDFGGTSGFAGALISNTEDLIHYLKHLKANHPLFLKDTLTELVPSGIPQMSSSLGWMVHQKKDTCEIIWHNGGTGGFTSFVAYDRMTQKGVVLLSNAMSLVDDIGFHILAEEIPLQHPEVTTAYLLADTLEKGRSGELVQLHQELTDSGYTADMIDIYWLERYHFGMQNYPISNQLCDIMLEFLLTDWEVSKLKAENLEHLGEYENAVSYYGKALELDSTQQQLKHDILRCEKLALKKQYFGDYKTLHDSVFEVGDEIIAPDIWYTLSATRIFPEHHDSVKLIAEFLSLHQAIKLEVGSHTDSRGSSIPNEKLSTSRAKGIHDLLIQKFGIASQRISYKGYGENHLAIPDEEINRFKSREERELRHQLNRRTVLKIKAIE